MVYYNVSKDVCQEIQNIPDFFIGSFCGLAIALLIIIIIYDNNIKGGEIWQK